MTSRTAILVTGTEVLTGRVTDRNGPWLAEQLRRGGVDIDEVIVVGDRPEHMLECLRFLSASGVDLIITSGGLGPTADDLTAAMVASAQGRELHLDTELEERITAILQRLVAGRSAQLDPSATAAGTRKQAMVPDGGSVLEPVGTAPGLVVTPADGRSGPPILVLPGPPLELQCMWPAAMADPIVLQALAGREEIRQSTVRLWETPESELAALMRAHEDQLTDLEITTCLRSGELEIVTRYPPRAQQRYNDFAEIVIEHFQDKVFSPGGATVDQLVADLLVNKGLTIATAESCTAGLLAGRLTDLSGSSAYVRGGLIVYSNEAKHELAGVPTELIDRVGAVSAEVAEALAAGARERLGADIGVGITGIAGPSGGSADKPVGLVQFCVDAGDSKRHLTMIVPGNRAIIRARAVLIAMHLVLEVLRG